MTDSYNIFKRSRISRKKFRQILRYFSLDLTASQITILTGLNRNTINRYLTLIRRSIALHCESKSPFAGEIELDESYFGAKRIRGKRGRGAYGKTIVFGIYNAMAASIPRSCPTVPEPRFMRFLKASLIPIQPSIPTGFAPMMVWSIWATRSTIASIIPKMNSPSARTISTVSKASGALPKSDS